jgi:RNA polymerase sigma-70 factor (ECF subfamily)
MLCAFALRPAQAEPAASVGRAGRIAEGPAKLARAMDPEPVERSDPELLQQFREGDRAAFEVLVRRYQRPVLSIARRFCDDIDEAEEIAQRAFVNAAVRASGWRGGSFKSWLFRIAVNLAKNHRRDVARFDRSEAAQEREAEPTQANAQLRLEEAEQRAALRAAVARLPARQREVLLLRIDGDLPFAEVASTLQITEVNAKVTFHHAVQKLRAWLAEK